MLLQDSRSNSAYIDESLQWLFKGVQFDRELRDGCTWTFRWLAKTALLWAWSAEAKLTERFACAQRLTRHLQLEDAKTETSWQAFAEVLRRHTQYMRSVLTVAFRKRMAQSFPEHWKMDGFVVLGVDGSDIAVPLTKSNEDAYASKKVARDRRKKKGNKGADKRSAGPQILLTTLFVVRLYLPWNWQIGGRGDSERGQLRLMLGDLPADCLIVADAGFVGYELAAEMLAQGAQIVMRVGSNVRLLKKLGYVRESNGIVYLWPDKITRKQLPPLVFRLIVIQEAKAPVYLITSVLDSKRLSDRAAIEIYSARWSIEVYHRHLKQTFRRGKLLSRNSDNARIELEWSLLSLWAMNLYASVELNTHGIALERISFAGVLDSFRKMARDYLHPASRRRTLRILLRGALLDTYQRKNKSSRNYPRRKKHKSPGPPEIQVATSQQQKHAKQLRNDP